MGKIDAGADTCWKSVNVVRLRKYGETRGSIREWTEETAFAESLVSGLNFA